MNTKIRAADALRPTQDPLLTPAQVVQRLALPSARTLEAWRYQGVGPRYYRVGRHIRYRETDLDAWLHQQAVA